MISVENKVFIWLIHCPRTGGTSIKNHCLDMLKKNLALFERTAHRRYSDAERDRMKKKYGRIASVTVVRDPITHAQSLFSYIRADRSHKENKLALSGFAQWIHKPSNNDYLVKFWGGNVELAERNLRQIDHVLQTENLKPTFNRVLGQLSLPKNFDRFSHKGDVKKYVLDDKEKELVRRFRSKDFELLKRLGFNYD